MPSERLELLAQIAQISFSLGGGFWPIILPLSQSHLLASLVHGSMLFGAAVIYLHVFPCFGIGVLAVEQGTQQLPRLADLDGLTGLPNRRCFIEQAKPLRLCRYGGEAFCLLLPQTTSLQATKLAARLRQYVSQREFEKSDSLHLPIALSIGVNSRPYKQQVLSLGALFSLADDAHGLAKCQGRNQVMAAASLLESRSKKLKIAIHKYASHSLI